MSWTNAVITDAGHRLQAALLGTGKGLVFTRAVSGAGLAEGALAAQTAVAEERQALSLQPVVPLADASARVQALLSNAGLETGYTIHQLGFYARAQDAEQEILYALVQDETGDAIPSAGESPGFSVDWTYIFRYGSADEITVTLDPAGVVGWGAVGVPGGVAGYEALQAHAGDAAAHVQDGERAKWNARGVPYAVQVSLPASGWSGSGPYTQTVTASGVTADMNPVADVRLSGDAAASKLMLESWARVSRMETLSGQVRATCYEEKPGVNLTVLLAGCKEGSA